MANQATVTAKIGPAITDTAVVLHHVTRVIYDFINQTAQFFCDEGNPIYDISGSTTLTISVSGTTYTLVVS